MRAGKTKNKSAKAPVFKLNLVATSSAKSRSQSTKDPGNSFRNFPKSSPPPNSWQIPDGVGGNYQGL